MQITSTLIERLLPLYAIVAIGFYVGKVLTISKETIARLLIYVIAPCVVFNGVVTTPLNAGRLVLPLFFLIVTTIMSLSVRLVPTSILNTKQRGVAFYSFGTGNTGYFGLPMTLVLLGQESMGIAILCALGFILFENSVGYYWASRAQNDFRTSLGRLLRLPSLYAFFLAMILNLSGFAPRQHILDMLVHFRGAYIVLGMLMVGVGMSDIKIKHISWKFLSISLIYKFIFWPLIIGGFLILTKGYLLLFDHQTRQVIFLMSLVPMAANTVAISSDLKLATEDASLAVFISTILALFYISFASQFLEVI